MGLLLCVPGKHLPEGPGHLIQWLWGFWSLRGGGGAEDQQRAGGALHEVRAGGPRLPRDQDSYCCCSPSGLEPVTVPGHAALPLSLKFILAT